MKVVKVTQAPPEGMDAYIRAIRRSEVRLVEGQLPVLVEPDHYVVPSKSGERYNVYVVVKATTILYECECKGFEMGLTCWHGALVSALPEERIRLIQVISKNNDSMSIKFEDLVPQIGFKFRERKIAGYDLSWVKS